MNHVDDVMSPFGYACCFLTGVLLCVRVSDIIAVSWLVISLPVLLYIAVIVIANIISYIMLKYFDE